MGELSALSQQSNLCCLVVYRQLLQGSKPLLLEKGLRGEMNKLPEGL